MTTKKPCPDCGETRWAASGYCLSVQCAGTYDHPDYPLSAPEEMKWNRTLLDKKKRTPPKPRVPKPPRKGRRALELQYEAMGQKAPWLQKDEQI